jgi:hypothetical protein
MCTNKNCVVLDVTASVAARREKNVVLASKSCIIADRRNVSRTLSHFFLARAVAALRWRGNVVSLLRRCKQCENSSCVLCSKVFCHSLGRL